MKNLKLKTLLPSKRHRTSLKHLNVRLSSWRKKIQSRLSLKQHDESQGSFSSSIETLQKKLKTLEQIDNNCSEHSKAREAEWNLRFEKVVADLNSCTLELGSKEAQLKKITKELNDCNSLVLQLTMEKQESEIMVLAMKSTLLEAKSNIDEENCDLVKVLAEIESVKTVKEKLMQTRSELMNVCDLLEKANEELTDSYCEVNEFEFELQLWKSVAEKLKDELELNYWMRKEVEDSLLSQVATEVNLKEDLEEKERKVNDLEKQLTELKEKTRLKLAKDNGAKLEKWEQEWVTKELEAAIPAQLESEKIPEHEKQSLIQDGQMMGTLRSRMSGFDENCGHVELKQLFDPLKENSHRYQSSKRNIVETSLDARSPLSALNR